MLVCTLFHVWLISKENQICVPCYPGEDAPEDLLQPAGSLPAGGALPAGLVREEPGEGVGHLDDAGGVVDHDHGAGAAHRARLHQGVEVEGDLVRLPRREHRRRCAAGDHRLELAKKRFLILSFLIILQ